MSELTQDELLKEIGEAFAGGVYTQLKEIVKEHFASEDCDWEEIKVTEYERGLKDAQQKPTVSREEKEGMIEMFTEMCNFMAVHGYTQEDKRAVDIRTLLVNVEVVE